MVDSITPLALGRAADLALWLSPTRHVWDHATPFNTGCDHGGTLSVAAGTNGAEYRFDACALWPDIILDGKALYAENGDPADGFPMQVDVSGLATGRIAPIANTVTGGEHLSGTWNGAEVITPRP